MADSNLGTMHVTLTGDVSLYKSALKDAEKATQGFASSVTQALSALGLGSILKLALGEFQTAETAAIRLNAILRVNGREVASLTRRYTEFAEELQRTTLAEDDAILVLIGISEQYRVTGAAAEESVRNALALSSALGGSAEQYIRFTAALARGDIEMAMSMTRMIRPLQHITDQTQFLAEAERLFATGMEAARAEAESSAGAFQILRRDLGNLAELFGEVVAQGIRPVVSWLTRVVASLRELDPTIKKAIVGVVALSAAAAAAGPALSIFLMIANPVRMFGLELLALLNPIRLVTVSLGILRNVLLAVRAVVLSMTGWKGLVLIAIAVVIGVVIEKLGGLEKALQKVKDIAGSTWDFIKDATQAFIEWFMPIWNAITFAAKAAWRRISDGVMALWGVIKTVFTAIGGFISGVWEAIGGGRIAFDDIREGIIYVIDIIGFAFESFEKIAQFTWTSIKLGAVIAWDTIRSGVVTAGAYVFATVRGVGAAFAAVWQNIRAGAQRLFVYMRAGFAAAGAAILAVFRLESPIDAFTNTLQRELAAAGNLLEFRGIGEAFGGAFEDGFRDATDFLGGTGPSELQAQLRREFEAQGAALTESFEDYRRRRMAALGLDPNEKKKLERASRSMGRDAGDQFAKGVGEAFDAVQRHTAEAISRIRRFLESGRFGERLRPTIPTPGGPGGGGIGGVMGGGEHWADTPLPPGAAASLRRGAAEVSKLVKDSRLTLITSSAKALAVVRNTFNELLKVFGRIVVEQFQDAKKGRAGMAAGELGMGKEKMQALVGMSGMEDALARFGRIAVEWQGELGKFGPDTSHIMDRRIPSPRDARNRMESVVLGKDTKEAVSALMASLPRIARVALGKPREAIPPDKGPLPDLLRRLEADLQALFRPRDRGQFPLEKLSVPPPLPPVTRADTPNKDVSRLLLDLELNRELERLLSGAELPRQALVEKDVWALELDRLISELRPLTRAALPAFKPPHGPEEVMKDLGKEKGESKPMEVRVIETKKGEGKDGGQKEVVHLLRELLVATKNNKPEGALIRAADF